MAAGRRCSGCKRATPAADFSKLHSCNANPRQPMMAVGIPNRSPQLVLVVSKEADAAAAAGAVGAHLQHGTTRGREPANSVGVFLKQRAVILDQAGREQRSTQPHRWILLALSALQTKNLPLKGAQEQQAWQRGAPACGSGWGAASTRRRRASKGRHRRGGTRPSVQGKGGGQVSAGHACMASFHTRGSCPV